MEDRIPPFVKKFDFRGEYGKEIKDEDAFYLGLALAKTIPLKKILIGWDTRESSRNLAINFITSLENKNIEISYLECCPIDYVTAASSVFDFDLSIMFTGSHNPWTWTGLLMHTKGGNSIQGKTVEKIVVNYYSSLSEPYLKPELQFSEFKNFYPEIEVVYEERIKSLIPTSEINELEVLIDIGDGSGTKSLDLLGTILPQVKFTKMNTRSTYDNSSPHTADPSEIKNMNQLISAVKNGKYSLGAAFDSDADRMLAVDENGEYLNGSYLGSVHIESLTQLNTTDHEFGYAVDCGPSVVNCVTEINRKQNKNIVIKPIPIGRSLVRQLLREKKLDFGIENVGHFYSKDFFMTDSGVFSLAIILYWISKNGPLSTLLTKYPDGFRGQVFIPILNGEKINKLIEDINSNIGIANPKKIENDGIRYEFYENDFLNCWYTIRKSGYEEITKCYFGALDESKFNFLKEKFESVE